MTTLQPSMPYVVPTRCGMPVLAGLDRNLRANMLLSLAFRGNALPTDYATRAMVSTYVRVAERAVEEYETARTQFSEFTDRPSNGHFFSLFRASDHLESCISHVDRACSFLRAMPKRAELAGLIPDLAVMIKANRQRIAILRNATEHLETRLVKGKISEGDYVMLCLGEDSCELERRSISYEELASWLTEMHSLASRLASEGTVQ